MAPIAIRHPSETSADTLQAHRLIRTMLSECSWSSTIAGTYTRYDIPRVYGTILIPGKVGAWAQRGWTSENNPSETVWKIGAGPKMGVPKALERCQRSRDWPLPGVEEGS